MCRALILFLLANFISALNCACNSFGRIEAEIQLKTGREYTKKITGCIDPTTVERESVRVTVVEEHVPSLKFGAVQNLINLAEAEFLNCSTTKLEAGAYRHLPALELIILKFSPLERIPNGVFANLPELHTIRLEKNKIKTIDDFAFANCPKLKQLFLSENRIETWKNSWFANSTVVEKLYFNANSIREIPANAFLHLGKLIKIWFEYNEIASIKKGAFNGLRRLRYLNLRHNRLTAIDPDAFPRNIAINSLYIDRNRLNFVSGELFDRISLGEIYLEGNPWKCHCLDRIFAWINQKNVSVKQEGVCRDDKVPVCVSGRVAAEMCLESVDEEATQYYLGQVKKLAADLGRFGASKCVRFD